MLASIKTNRTILLLFVGAFVLVACSAQPQIAVQQPKATRIELTESDLFALGSWTSTQVSVLGFHLGMTWPDALAKARDQKLQLRDTKEPGVDRVCTGKGRCEIFNSVPTNAFPSGHTIGLSLIFGERQEINELLIDKIPSGVPVYDEMDQVSLRFKGETFKLFHQYSNERRLKLLGRETSGSEDGFYKTFKYPGLEVDLESAPSDLTTLSFVAPTEKR